MLRRDLSNRELSLGDVALALGYSERHIQRILRAEDLKWETFVREQRMNQAAEHLMWRSWEHLRLDGNLGISVWMRDHLDHHMAVLLDADGPFKGCKPDQHAQRVEAFPLEPPIPLSGVSI